MSDCIFCKIVVRQAPGSIVYEDDTTLAIMDIHQPTTHKVLIIPRTHAVMIYDLSDDQAAAIMQLAVKIARVQREVTQCEGLSIFQSNGSVAGQDVFHYHLHLLPRFAKNDHHQDKREAFPPRETLDRMAADLRTRLEFTASE
ncbi:MAG: HIT domain-containing protein [Anaerolineales bacterium]|nr:HIT domain-containing protein [Anaerolineales bacterium]